MVPASAGLAFAAGLASSIGPCVAPRYLALAALARGGTRARFSILGCFAGGTALGYGALAEGGSAVAALLHHSSWLYAGLACALVLSAALMLRDRGDRCCAVTMPRSLGGVAVLGLSSAFIVSPCCTPLVLALGSLYASTSPAVAVSLVAAFTLGHLAPLAFVLAPWRLPAAAISSSNVVSAGVTLALGAYYGLLA